MLRVSKGGSIFLVQNSNQVSFLVGRQIPQTAVVPMTGILPIVPVQNRVDANPVHRDTPLQGQIHFNGRFSQPARATDAEVGRLGHEDRTVIAIVRFGKQ